MDNIDEFEVGLTARLKDHGFDVIVWHITPDSLKLCVEKGALVYRHIFTRREIEQANANNARWWVQKIIAEFASKEPTL